MFFCAKDWEGFQPFREVELYVWTRALELLIDQAGVLMRSV